jgi:photosystem II stability/assembly factor-like uncharacterized protein
MRPLMLPLLALTLSGHAQWTIQSAPTTADLRGIDSVGNGVAWASGTKGTVLRTEDLGKTWQACAVPTGAETLDFRGVQAFDAKTAIVMSSGKGDLSRLYKTTDGCATWKLIHQNTAPDGFWDAVVYDKKKQHAEVVGDPVGGHFFVGSFYADIWIEECNDPFSPTARAGEAAFAASNSSLLTFGFRDFMIGTGGTSGARVIFFREEPVEPGSDELQMVQQSLLVPVGKATSSSGIFSLAGNNRGGFVAVGGDYEKPDDMIRIAAFGDNGGQRWTPADTQPHGYRSAVAYDASTKTWITVGPNGTDISTDDGRNWRALKPIAGDAPDADQHWNALSLPFVVGPKGRIGLLETDALKQAQHK